MLYVFKEQMQDKYNSHRSSDVFLYVLHIILWSGIVMLRSNNHQ